MKRVICVYVLAFVVMLGVGAAIAQETAKPPVTPAPAGATDEQLPVVTNEIRLEIKDRLKTMEDLVDLTTPKAIGELVEQIMTARHQAVEKARVDVNAYLAGLTKGPYAVKLGDLTKPETWVYEKRADIKK